MHQLVALILRAKQFFNTKGVADDDLIVHLPLPLHWDLSTICGDYEGLALAKKEDDTAVFGLKTVPAYENRICISNPADAFTAGSPVVVIEGFNKGEVLKYRVEE